MGQFVLAGLGRTADPMRQWVNEVPNDGMIRFLDIFNAERIPFVSPKALAEVLVHKSYDFIKPPRFTSLLAEITGIGLLLAEGDEHKVQRKNLLPAFAFRHVKELYPVFWAKSKELVAAVTSNADGSSIEIKDWASRATLDIIGVAGFGEDFKALSDPDNELSRTYKNVFSGGRRTKKLGTAFRVLLPRWFIRSLPSVSHSFKA